MMYSIHHAGSFRELTSKRTMDRGPNPIPQLGNQRRLLWRRRLAGGFVSAAQHCKIAGGTPAPLNTCLREENMEARAARSVLLQANRAAMVVHDFRNDGKA